MCGHRETNSRFAVFVIVPLYCKILRRSGWGFCAGEVDFSREVSGQARAPARSGHGGVLTLAGHADVAEVFNRHGSLRHSIPADDVKFERLFPSMQMQTVEKRQKQTLLTGVL
jgi:hypothetical protein